MEVLATLDDVQAALGRPLRDDLERATAERLLEEASALVATVTDVTHDDEGGVLRHVALVVSRMVARSLLRPSGLDGVESMQETYGPFSHSNRFVAGYSDGGVWLSATDRQMLGAGRSSGAHMVELVSERFA